MLFQELLLIQVGTIQSREQQSNEKKKNTVVIPTPISRWLHKLQQSERGTNNWESFSGRVAWIHSHSWHTVKYDECSAFVVSLNSLTY